MIKIKIKFKYIKKIKNKKKQLKYIYKIKKTRKIHLHNLLN